MLGLLEGERVHRVVHPHPLARLPLYGPGLALLAFAALLALLQGEGWRGFAAAVDASLGPAAVPLMLVSWWLGLAACTAPFALRRGSPLPLAYGVGVAVLGGFAAVLLTLPDPSAPAAFALLPWLTLAAVPAPLLAGEVARRSSSWALTNFRLVHREGWPRAAEEGWRLTRLQRVDVQHRGPRALDLGDLVVASAEGPVRVPGVRPATRLRDELEMLLHTSPEAPFLAEQRDTLEKVARLLRPGEGAR